MLNEKQVSIVLYHSSESQA